MNLKQKCSNFAKVKGRVQMYLGKKRQLFELIH